MKKKVLFITYGGGHVNIVVPIVKKMLMSTTFEPIVIGLTNATHKLTQNRIPYFKLLDCLEGEHYQRSYEVGEKLAMTYHNPESGLSMIDTISYLGPSVYDLVLTHGYTRAMSMFSNEGRKVLYPTHVMRMVLQKFTPDLVVSTCGQRAEHAMVTVAKESEIPSLRIVDLFGHTGTIAKGDFYAVINEYAKNSLISRGLKSNSIYITGQPAFESLNDITIEEQKNVLTDIESDASKRIVTYASQKTEEDRDVLIEILDTFKYLPNYQLIIKLHPSESSQMYDELCKNCNVKVIRNINMQVLLSVSDVVLTQYSTCGLEAILLGKPLITINLSGKPDIMPYASSGAALGVNKKGALLDAMKKIGEASTLKQLLDARIQYKMRDNPTEEIIKLIGKITLLKQGE